MCEHCVDENGVCLYPYYGIAPHEHLVSESEPFILYTISLLKSKWPDFFKEDPDVPGCGTYLYCPECGNAT